jgi:hypothetical protein
MTRHTARRAGTTESGSYEAFSTSALDMTTTYLSPRPNGPGSVMA